MLIKRSWLLIGMVLILLIGVGLAVIACTIFQNQDNERAADLGLTPSEFEILDTAIHEYLYQKYPFLSDTEFGIRYERVDTKVEGIPPESLVIDAYATFRVPPVVVRAALYDGNVQIISEKVLTEFEIRYEKVDTKVEGTPPKSLVIDAYATFRVPPVVVRVALYDGNVLIISEKVLDEEA